MLVGARLLQFSGALTLFGSALFFLYGLDASRPNQPPLGWPTRVLWFAAVAALLGTVFWVMAETASFSDEARDALNPFALWTVLWETRFGRACLLRITLLGVSLIALLAMTRTRRLWSMQSALGALVLLTFAWTGHGAMDRGLSGVVHVAADALHLLAAGAWIGALLPLLLQGWVVLRQPTAEKATGLLRSLDRFSAIGIWIVLAITLTGIINGLYLVGWPHRQALWTTDYGLILLLKLVFFAGMLVLGAHHRYRAGPALGAALQADKPNDSAIAALRTSLFIETGLALCVLLAVSVLGTLEPPISTE